MWGRNRVKAVENRLAKAEEDIQAHARRLKMLECSHGEITFVGPVPHALYCYVVPYQTKCQICGKVMETHLTRIEFLAAKLSYMREHYSEGIAQAERELKEAEEAEKGRQYEISQPSTAEER